MKVHFRCGHVQGVDPDRTPSPVCKECGERVIARVVGAQNPRFSGTVTGPLADTKKLDPIAVQLAERPLILKPDPMTVAEKEPSRAH